MNKIIFCFLCFIYGCNSYDVCVNICEHKKEQNKNLVTLSCQEQCQEEICLDCEEE